MRRTALRFVYEKFDGCVSGDKGYMTLQQACTLFGFQMNESWSKKEIDKRFRSLVHQFHPDHGGSNEQFREIREAHKLLLSHRRDRHKDRRSNADQSESSDKKDVGSTFSRNHNSKSFFHVHHEMSNNPELGTFKMSDFAVFCIFISIIIFIYIFRTVRTQRAILRGRWSYTTEQLEKDELKEDADIHQWHPWKSDNETRDAMDEIGLIQGNIRKEVVERKRMEAPRVYTPWQPGGPFSPKSSSVLAEKPSSSLS